MYHEGVATDLHGSKTGMVGGEEKELQDGVKDMFMDIPPPT